MANMKTVDKAATSDVNLGILQQRTVDHASRIPFLGPLCFDFLSTHASGWLSSLQS
ncbi:hypothetical protein M422DRAFT_264109 [Sphaerobolus stellatus SS14]|uniref:Uncharacterized protein n=1 Tax=Sphaerobolus stellatus (strain SS14) TaxID=990650 RepID=A0A0C9UGB2_SPHS4|nr:hypothetical protein M422DRAFT_264109 [Sphaerobolus stellatus SS14]